jgi:hypothetical protein
METGLFEIQAEHPPVYPQSCQVLSDSHAAADFGRASSVSESSASGNAVSNVRTMPDCGIKTAAPNVEFARCFLRLANLPNFALDRLSRYEATLWRQAGRILHALETLERRKPHERTRRFCIGSTQELSGLGRE